MPEKLKVNYDRLPEDEVTDIELAMLIAQLEANEQHQAIARELRTMNRLKAYELTHTLPSGAWMGDKQEIRKILEEDLTEITRPGEQTRINQISVLCMANRGVD